LKFTIDKLNGKTSETAGKKSKLTKLL